jgi:hypothetical protein
MKYRLEIQYPAYLYPEVDHAVRPLVGPYDDAGMGFGWRDGDWFFQTEAERTAAFEKLAALRGRWPQIQLVIEDTPEEDL